MKQEQPERAGGKPERIRIQPREIDVPPNNSFENDRLGRKDPAEILTHLLSYSQLTLRMRCRGSDL